MIVVIIVAIVVIIVVIVVIVIIIVIVVITVVGGTAPGVAGMRYEHLRAVLTQEASSSQHTTVCNLLIACHIPQSIRDLLYSGCVSHPSL